MFVNSWVTFSRTGERFTATLHPEKQRGAYAILIPVPDKSASNMSQKLLKIFKHAPPALAREFVRKVNITPGGCWVWEAGKNSKGYGRFKNEYAHRLAYRWSRGRKIPRNLEIDHLCRNRACVRFDHLELVTRRTNTLRGHSPSAINARKYRCPKGHPYNHANTLITTSKGRQRRVCRVCHRAAWHKWKKKRILAHVK